MIVVRLIVWVIEVYVFVLIARALLSWFPVRRGTPLATVAGILERLTEPVLAPVRRLIPPIRAGAMAVDLSLIVVIIGLEILTVVLLRL